MKAAKELFSGAIFRRVGMQAEVRQHLMLHTHEQAVLIHATRACASETAALLHRLKVYVGRNFHRGGADFIERRFLKMTLDDILRCMQCGRVEIVSRVVLHLKPVAMLKIAVWSKLIARQHGIVAFPFRKRRLVFRRPHIVSRRTRGRDVLLLYTRPDK